VERSEIDDRDVGMQSGEVGLKIEVTDVVGEMVTTLQQTDEGKEIYRKPKKIVEPVFGISQV
jgi:hypothetical protein